EELTAGFFVNHEAVEVARRAVDVAQELAVWREHLQSGRRILHADVHVARGTDRDIAMLVAELRPAVRQLQPVAGDGVVACRRRGSDESEDSEKNEAGVLHGGGIIAPFPCRESPPNSAPPSNTRRTP